ncbi:Hypothetical protein A7982_07305 [Minicystis rosea]|nr:Hypothetical protein A7982_07305 [Minicystis rosea]
MRRTRKDATKVWHNPDIHTVTRRSGTGGGGGSAPRAPVESAEDRRHAKQHRAALEALFAPKREPEADDAKAKNGAPSKASGRIVLAPPPQTDSRAAERQKLLSRLLVAEGRPGVSKAADAFLAAGFTFPEEQDVYLQLLEHAREEHVRGAIDRLDTILAGELPKRRAVLESRLRRIEQFAEDEETREAAARLRRRVSGRPQSSPIEPQ